MVDDIAGDGLDVLVETLRDENWCPGLACAHLGQIPTAVSHPCELGGPKSCW
ncbi:hypothetical protein RHMOL_Rhmol07G0125700 [Rhododendron molle]|uniref:Uncharacterized protein n=1 Tax=Rhododendron molle TaxID=49168 RepID=A0ACC0N111_RHOML|nr:hypothetical protein RHMOL_Rhmol07G0125700 [Rhododendron molle]